MTILGDKAQTMDEKMQDVTRFLPKVLGKDIRIIQMNKKAIEIPWKLLNMQENLQA